MQGNAVIQICQNVGSTVAVALYTLIIGICGVVKGIHTAFVVALVFSLLALGTGVLMENVGKERESKN